jgi:hypothetical protein
VTQETGLTKQQILSELTRSPHGALAEYVPVGQRAAQDDPEFLAHMVAWNEKKGSIRDSKVALPVVSLSVPGFNGELAENSLAHLALLDPRNLLRAVRFAREPALRPRGWMRQITATVERYLRAREAVPPWWDRAALQHRTSMRGLYALLHVKPCDRANNILFAGVKTGVFKVLAELQSMPAAAAAGAIAENRIPFLIAVGALGARAKEEELVLALIDRMTPAELVTNSKALERLGVGSVPALRAAYDQALVRAAEKGTGLKATRAAGAVKSVKTRKQLAGVQEKQLAAGAGIEGNWLVLGDKSGSMACAIEGARQVAATLTKFVRGKVWLVFFDTAPRALEVTGKTYEQILAETARVKAGGGTSVGCGLQWALDNGCDFDGVAIVSDAAENTAPLFAAVYGRAAERLGKEVPVYLYWMIAHGGGPFGYLNRSLQNSMARAGHDLQVFELRGNVDYYALPNLVLTMRANRYSLIDEVLATPLLTRDAVFTRTTEA